MQPNVPQGQSVQAADSPLDPGSLQLNPLVTATPATAAAGAAPVNATGDASAQQTVEQVKQLIEQYKQDPFKLSGAVGELKTRYLTEHYQIAPNSVDQ